MRLCLAAAILATTALTPAFAAEIAANSRIAAVTVYPSGAEITREAEAKIEAGEHTLIFTGLPGDLDPATIRVEGTAEAQVEIGSVDSKSVQVPAPDTGAAHRRIELEIEALQDERSRLDQAIGDAEYQKSLMQQLTAGAIPQPVKEGETRPFGAPEIAGLLDLVGGKLQALSKTVFDSRLRQRQIDKRITELLAEMERLAPRLETDMTVSVHLAAPAAATGTFRLKYRIANAGWRPIYDARLSSPAKDTAAKIELVRRAEVMQSTTENWTDVALTLSTARPLGATAAPVLEPLHIPVYYDELARQKSVGAASDQELRSDVPQSAPVLSEESAMEKDGRKAQVAQREADVEIAGFQALYDIPGRVSIDNTGTAKKVRIATDAIDAKLSALTVPKLDPNAYLTAAFTLDGETPLLPGTVMLYRDGVFMGQGYLPLLSPGEESKLGFGADDLIKVKRVEVKRKTGEEGLITTSSIDERAFDIAVRNLHDFALPVTVVDRMPFSTVDDVTVEALPGMTPATHRDFEKKRGVLAWDFTLEPKAEQVIKHGYKIAWPKDMNVGMSLN
jgi:uncharacterized protein (TIGR02231 family)